MPRATAGWIALGWVGYAGLPWYGFGSAESEHRRQVRDWSSVSPGPGGSSLCCCPSSWPFSRLRRAGASPAAGSWRRAFWDWAFSFCRASRSALTAGAAGSPTFRRAGPEPGRHGRRCGAHHLFAPHRSLSRPRRPGMVPGRRLRGLGDRGRRRAHRDLRVLPRRDDPRQRRAGQPGELRAGRVRREVPRPLDLGPGLPRLGPALRRRLEHALPRRPRRVRHHRPGLGVRAHRHPHRISASSAACA